MSLAPFDELAVADGAGLEVRFPENETVYVPASKDTVVGLPHVLGGVLVAHADHEPGARLRVAFDPRVYELAGEPSLVAMGDRYLSCRWIKRGRRTAIVAIQEPLQASGEYRLTLGRRTPLTFPEDIVADPEAPSITSVKTGNSYSPASKHSELSTRVWGMKVGAGWSDIVWGEYYRSWVPELVTVSSVGPHPIPKSTIVTVQLDARLIEAAVLKPPGDAPLIVGKQEGGRMVMRWKLAEPLRAGQSVTAFMNFTARNPTTPLPGFEAPSITAAPAKAALGQRITGEESIQRHDSQFDAQSVATFGPF